MNGPKLESRKLELRVIQQNPGMNAVEITRNSSLPHERA